MHITRFKTILNRIKSNPECWNQKIWHFGTSHCFAGHAQIDSGNEIDTWNAYNNAKQWLNLTESECDYIFNKSTTIENFEVFLKKEQDHKKLIRQLRLENKNKVPTLQT